jgi:D-beta-D-heptose 7-phosphate kinase/D-beta-D-heptose 1-phosphate adenosyltransferase
LHVGHVKLLAEAAAQGDVLFVGLNSDASVRRLKGPNRPVIGERDRAALLAALASVRQVVLFDENTPKELIEAIRPDVLVKGGTYTHEEIVGHDFVTSYGGRVYIAKMIEGISTTSILEALARGTTLYSNDSKAASTAPKQRQAKP